jgi:hypothetical protein
MAALYSLMRDFVKTKPRSCRYLSLYCVALRNRIPCFSSARNYDFVHPMFERDLGLTNLGIYAIFLLDFPIIARGISDSRT